MSLLRDAFVEWEEEFVLDLVIRYWEKARAAQLPVPAEFDEFYRWFEWMGVQRHLKVAGIFARLYYRDGKDNTVLNSALLELLAPRIPPLQRFGAAVCVAGRIGRR